MDPHGETFADPVIVPGPHPRSLFVDTEEVDDTTTELLPDPPPADDEDA